MKTTGTETQAQHLLPHRAGLFQWRVASAVHRLLELAHRLAAPPPNNKKRRVLAGELEDPTFLRMLPHEHTFDAQQYQQ